VSQSCYFCRATEAVEKLQAFSVICRQSKSRYEAEYLT